MIKTPYKLLTSAVFIAGISACGGNDTTTTLDNNVPEVVTPTAPAATEISLETPLFDINLDEPTKYEVNLASDAQNLVVSLGKGFQQDVMGDPDIYVKYDGEASKDNFDCVSFNGNDQNETCIINQPKAGRYSIWVDVANNSQVSHATLWASTRLLAANKQCNELLTIRAQSMNEAELDKACANVNIAKDAFFNLFSSISPAPETAIADDLNDHVNMTVFSSLSNHTRWINYLFNDNTNRSGIFYEGTPNEWYHKAEIVTFNPLEWTDGYSLVRSDNHEFIHALDGRFNKAGGYRQGLGWWSEGLAEYLTTTAYDKYKLSQQNDDAGNPYTLSEIFKGFSGNASPYDGGQLAVMFFLEQHPDLVTQLLEQSRAGNWSQWDALLANWAVSYQDEFSQWLSVGPKTNFENSAQALTLGEPAAIEGRHGWLYALNVNEATDALTIQLHGNQADQYSMNLDLYVSKDSVATTMNYQCSSQQVDSNEVCTFNNVTPGTYYITLDSNLTWAADYTDTYLTACTGANCNVALPARMAQKEIVDVAIPLPEETLPEVNTFASCESVRPYVRGSDAATVTVTNTTAVPIKLYWINNSTGEPNFSSVYATLAQGESYTADYWAMGDRMVVTDSENNCLGVAIMQQAINEFQVDEALVKDAVLPEVSAISSCDLASAYTRSSDSASITITNKTAKPVNLYWIDYNTGNPYLDNAYATLQQDESYSADYWVIGDRMMITDVNNSCLGVADLNRANNIFEVDSSINP